MENLFFFTETFLDVSKALLAVLFPNPILIICLSSLSIISNSLSKKILHLQEKKALASDHINRLLDFLSSLNIESERSISMEYRIAVEKEINSIDIFMSKRENVEQNIPMEEIIDAGRTNFDDERLTYEFSRNR